MAMAAVQGPPWHIRRSGFPAAWLLAASRPAQQRPVRVGILDSGINAAHPSMARLLGAGVNLLRPGEPPADENGHGTQVAGLIALAAGALAPEGRPAGLVLHPVKIFDQTGYGRIADIIRGMLWGVEHGMDIINLSFGTDLKTSDALAAAVQEAERAGVLLVAAAGNDGRQGTVDFPGRYAEVLAVAACTRADRLAPFSSAGPEVNLIAPGCGVYAPAPGGGFQRVSGTSMAAPHVTAAAALLLGLEPHLLPAQVRERLEASAEWLPTVPLRAQGSGMLRADRALRWRP